MGTSSSYKGSSGKAPKAIREGLEDWAGSQTDKNHTDLPKQVVAQALNIPSFSRSSGSGGGSGGGASGGGATGGGGQSSPQRSISSYARTAGRAASVAGAFRSGDRVELERAGLDFDTLAALSSNAERVRAIVDVICAADPNSDIASEEQRAIAGKLVDWMLDDTINQSIPDSADAAEHAIGLIAAEIFLSEAGDSLISGDGVSRDEMIDRINETSQAIAAQADIGKTGTDAKSIEKAITTGVKKLRGIYSQGKK